MQEPWLEHQDMLTEKRPFQINSVRCTACCNDGESVYSALVRYQIPPPPPDVRVVMSISISPLLALMVGISAGRRSSLLPQV